LGNDIEACAPGAGRCLTVLGMHRSGTSMLMGTLQEAGVYLGSVFSEGFEGNRKGLLEPRAVLFMQEDLLKANGGSWSEPPATLEWKNLHLAVRDLFVESRERQPLWGFKDPRTLFTLDGWRNVLPRLELVGIFRHPAAVAASLQRRNGFEIEKGLALWTRYNERLLAIHAATPFPVIEFHPSGAQLRLKLSAVLETLRLPDARRPDDLSFFEEGISRHDDSATELPAEVVALYRRLQDIAL
jgi:hypothetical protein